MKFTCTQENLHKGLAAVQGISGNTTALPILKNILIEAKDGAINLKATDLEVGITSIVRGKVDKEGSITVEAKLLSSFVSLLPRDKVEVQSDGKNVTVLGGAHKTKINGLSSDDFPVIPGIQKDKECVISLPIFKKALSQILPAVSFDDTRPELHGVYVSINDKTITLVGTDSYRLAEKKAPLVDPALFTAQFILPLKTAKEFLRSLEATEEKVILYHSENQALIVYGSNEIVSRLVDGNYPNYQQIIPTSHTMKCIINREEFINAVRISGLFASVGSNNVTLTIVSGKGMKIASRTIIGEEQTELYPHIEGEGELTIAFDYRYLLDGLTAIDAPEIALLASSPSAPVLLKPLEENEGEEFIYIVMPIRQ